MRYEDRVRLDRVWRETLRARCDHPHRRRGREAEEEEDIKTPRAGIRPHPPLGRRMCIPRTGASQGSLHRHRAARRASPDRRGKADPRGVSHRHRPHSRDHQGDGAGAPAVRGHPARYLLIGWRRSSQSLARLCGCAVHGLHRGGPAVELNKCGTQISLR